MVIVYTLVIQPKFKQTEAPQHATYYTCACSPVWNVTSCCQLCSVHLGQTIQIERVHINKKYRWLWICIFYFTSFIYAPFIYSFCSPLFIILIAPAAWFWHGLEKVRVPIRDNTLHASDVLNNSAAEAWIESAWLLQGCENWISIKQWYSEI